MGDCGENCTPRNPKGREPASRQSALHKELEELIAAEPDPAPRARDRSSARRLAEGGGPLGEIRKRYEAGRSRGRFPVLSAFLAGASDEDFEEFFRTGWKRISPPPVTQPDPRPWDHAPWSGNMEAYREDLYSGIAFGLPDVRAFAREWLEELLRVGYYGMEESLGLPLKQQASEYSSPPKPLPLYGESYPTRLGDTGQTVWLQLDGTRSPKRGYREISVSDEPLRTDAAILAALTALEGRQLDLSVLRKALPQMLPLRGESFWDRWTQVSEDRRVDENLRATLRDLQHHQALDYVLTLLRYHRPGFDDLPPEDRAELVAETCGHANDFLMVLRKLVAFLEHGRPNRRGPAATRVAARDIKAAVLKDVDGLTNRQIGEELCIPLPADFLVKGDHPTVRKMAGRGRRILEAALGEEGWQRQAQAMKAEAERWRSIGVTRREKDLEAEYLGLTLEETMDHPEEKRQQSSVVTEHGGEAEVAL